MGDPGSEHILNNFKNLLFPNRMCQVCTVSTVKSVGGADMGISRMSRRSSPKLAEGPALVIVV